jgi:Flp pilus assembly protein TadD
VSGPGQAERGERFREVGLSGQSQHVGSLEIALGHAARLLASQPRLAAEQASEILKVVPGHRGASLLLGVAYRSCGDVEPALLALRKLCHDHPDWALAHYELAVTLGRLGQGDAAIAALRRAVELKPNMSNAWRALGDHLSAVGDAAGADAAYARHIKAASKDPRLLAAAAALVENRIPEAEARLREHLQRAPTDVAALRMLAEVGGRLGRHADAEILLARCLELAPSFDAARHNYAMVLNRQGKPAAALTHVRQLLVKEPHNPGYRTLMAAILANLGNYDEAKEIYHQLLQEYPQQPNLWMSYGHTLKTTGHLTDSIEVYRRALTLRPTLGEAYWSLANLKTFRFADADSAAMRKTLARHDLSDEDRLHVEFSLGKALEDAERYEDSFEHYAKGNALHRKLHPYSAATNTRFVHGAITLFTKEFFAARAGSGCPTRDPIFILGLPRAGSTLLEQVLASHSLVEGTMELPNLPKIAREIARGDGSSDELGFHEALASLSGAQLRAHGERYIESTRSIRKTGAPFFIDKMPNNWLYVGLIHLILPNATIIDARRHPLGCCLSCYKQHFARGQTFTYDLEDLGWYYRDYVELMTQFDAVLPGRVHRVIYERMIEETEAQTRRLLAGCGLEFEEACLRFYENERAVRTASSEQVRQPIFREGLDHWRHYEPWLGSLRGALGPVLATYPEVSDSL